MLALFLTGCQSGASPPVFLGQVANLSGTNHTGKHAEQGIRLALKQLSDDRLREALDGRTLQIRHADTRGQLDAYEGEAVRLAAVNRVIGLLGGQTTDEVARLDRSHVPLVAAAGVRPPGASDNVFAIGMRPAPQAFILAKYAAEDLNLDDVAVFVDERREEFVALADAFARQFAEARRSKGRVAAPPVPIRFGDKADWAELAKRMATPAAAAKAVLFAGKARDCVELRRKLPFATAVIFAGDDGDTAELQGTSGMSAVYLATAFAPDAAAPRQQAFMRQYRDAFHAEAEVPAALGYESLQLYAEALKQISPTFAPEKLQTALGEVKEFAGLAGALSMTADRYVRRPLYLARLDGNSVQMVKRFEAAALP
jgi:branched-chain amino acid transport system substrate-binding protein